MSKVANAMTKVKAVRDKVRLILGRSGVVTVARDSKGLHVEAKILYKTTPPTNVPLVIDGVRVKIKKVYRHKGKG